MNYCYSKGTHVFPKDVLLEEQAHLATDVFLNSFWAYFSSQKISKDPSCNIVHPLSKEDNFVVVWTLSFIGYPKDMNFLNRPALHCLLITEMKARFSLIVCKESFREDEHVILLLFKMK